MKITPATLRALKAQHRVTLSEIAKKLGYSDSGDRYLSKILNGREYVSDEKLSNIKNAIVLASKEREAA